MPATASIMFTAEQIAALPEIAELNIGYYMIGEALFAGLGETVRVMRAAMDRGRGKLAGKPYHSIGSDLIDIRASPRSSSATATAFSTAFSPKPSAPGPAPRQERENVVAPTPAVAAKEACSKALGPGS